MLTSTRPRRRAWARFARLAGVVALVNHLAARVEDACVFRQRHVRRAVLEPAAGHADAVARLDDVPGPAPALQLRGGARFTAPPDDLASIFVGVEHDN